MRILSGILVLFLSFGFSINWAVDDVEIPKRFEKLIKRKLVRQFKSDQISVVKTDRKLMSANTGSCMVLYSVKDQYKKDLAFLAFKTTEACSFGGCVNPAVKQPVNVFRDKIYYYVLLNTDYTVRDIRVLEHESSYGIEIGTRYWLKQFFNQKPGNYKLGKDIDGISGATVSVQAMIDDLNTIQPQ